VLGRNSAGAVQALGEWVRSNTTMKVDKRYTGDFSWLELASQ
jgi:hypothetical protein